MDSNEFNKIAGAVIGSLLAFLLLGFFSSQIFHAGEGAHEAEEPLAFALDTGEEEAAEGEAPPAEEQVDLAMLLEQADAGAGEKVFGQCKACHKLEDGMNAVGPHLWNVVGREIAGVDGYGYSDALAGKEGEWDLEALLGFLENPQEWAPGTLMGYAGLGDIEDRINLIVYLNENGTAPADLRAMIPAEMSSAEPAAEEPQAAQETETAEAEPAAEEPQAAQETGTAEAEPAVGEAEPAAEETQTAEAGPAEEEAQMAGADAGADSELAGLVADASAERGEKVFRQCAACHKVQDGVNAVGPHLWDVVGREIAAVESYSYSDALASKEGAWDLEALYAYLEAPMEWAPGTKMVYPGLKDPQDRVDVITYLNEADGSPIEFDVAAAPAAEDATAETGDAPADEQAAAEEAEAAPAEDAEAGQTAETGQAQEGDAAETGMAAADAGAGMAEAEAPAAEEQAADAASAEDGGEAPAAYGTEMAAAEAESEAPSGDAAAEPAAGQTAGAGGELAALVENASTDRGEATFRQCSVCHKVEDGANAVGPHLWGVVGREIASVDSFGYSDALKSKEGVWDLETLFAYLEAPMEWAPGTKMVYPGLKDPQDRVDVIAYLNEADGSPVEFQVAAAPAPPEDAEAAAGTATEDAAAEETAAEQAATEEMATEEAATADTATADTATEDTAAAETSTEAEAPAEDGTQMAAVAPEATDTGAASEGKYTELLAAADPAAGEAAFRQCRACHQVREGVHGVGPSLHGVVGRPIGAIDDYRYSNALKGLEGEWTLEKLMAYLENPRDWAPGTKMIYSGLEDAQTRANLIAWLNEQSDDPVSLD